jgi:hypothetical protein
MNAPALPIVKSETFTHDGKRSDVGEFLDSFLPPIPDGDIDIEDFLNGVSPIATIALRPVLELPDDARTEPERVDDVGSEPEPMPFDHLDLGGEDDLKTAISKCLFSRDVDFDYYHWLSTYLCFREHFSDAEHIRILEGTIIAATEMYGISWTEEIELRIKDRICWCMRSTPVLCIGKCRRCNAVYFPLLLIHEYITHRSKHVTTPGYVMTSYDNLEKLVMDSIIQNVGKVINNLCRVKRLRRGV